MLSTAEEQVLSEISGERARRYVEQMQTLMDRTSGSEAEYQNALKAKALLEPFVDTCELEGYPAVTNIRGKGRLEMVSPFSLSIACEVNGLSGSGKGTGRLLDAGGGTRYDYKRLGGAVQGAVVLISSARHRIGVWWQLLAREAALHGASCLVYHPGGWDDDVLCVHGINVDFPVLTISNRSAVGLRRLLAEHGEVTVRFEANHHSWRSTGHSVVGSIKGSLYPKEVIYLSGHHDGYFHGANDNLSSCACVIEVAKLLSRHRPRRTFKFILFGGEESGRPVAQNIVGGLHGSFCYSEAHRSELLGGGQSTICAINGEYLGHTPRSRITCSPELIPLVREVATQLGDHIEVVGGPDGWWTDSDHLCLHTLGIPTIYLHDRVADQGSGRLSRASRVYHSIEDNIDIISARALESNARLMALLALRLDAADVPPYSMEGVMAEVKAGSERLPERTELIELIREKALLISNTADREERLRRTLRLLAVTNTQLYTYILRDFLHKFRLLSDTAAKLREAYHIADMEGDLGRARAVLVSITRGSVMDNLSAEVLEQMKAVKAAPSVLSRISPYYLELRDLLDRIDGGAVVGEVLASIEAKRQEVMETAKRWQQEFADAVRGL